MAGRAVLVTMDGLFQTALLAPIVRVTDGTTANPIAFWVATNNVQTTNVMTERIENIIPKTSTGSFVVGC